MATKSNHVEATTQSSSPQYSNTESIAGHRVVLLQVFLWIFTSASLYVFVMLLLYECKAVNRGNRSDRKRNSCGRLRAKNSSKKYGKHLRVVNIIAAGLLFVRTIVEHIEILHQEVSERDICSNVITLKIILAGMFFTAVYAFLWLRQRMCYTNPSMCHLTSSFTKVLSWVSLLALLGAEVVTIGLFVFTRSYRRFSDGCDVQDTFTPPSVVWIVYGATTATFQVAFLILFIHPLLKQRQLIKGHKHCALRQKKIVPVVRRSLTACAVCVVTNLFVSMLLIFIKEPYNALPIILYNVNLFINLVAVITSFSRWRMILIPIIWRKGKVTSLFSPKTLKIETGCLANSLSNRGEVSFHPYELSSSIYTISTRCTVPSEGQHSAVLEKTESDTQKTDFTD